MTVVARSTLQQRLQRIEDEICGVRAQYGVTDWEVKFLQHLGGLSFGSPKQMRVLATIEKKVFGEEYPDE